jgi:nucleolar protein 6
MKTCLEKFHHSDFNDGISPARKINVELTAGGGGKKANRREKIKEKNFKLKDERARRALEEKEAKKGKQAAKAEDGKEPTQVEQKDTVHPSRRKQVPQQRK